MRELKFRAWDEKEKCWIGGFAIHQSGMFSDWAGCKKVNGQCIADANWQYPQEIPHIKIMQYTGLKDKNGKEIYEGDIVSDRYANFYTPIFRNGIYMAYNVDYLHLTNQKPSTQFNVVWKNDCEVIGNIYENPELLKGDGNA